MRLKNQKTLTITTAMPNSPTKIILGIDPGIADTGFGVIKQTGKLCTMITYGTIKTKAGEPAEKRLKIIYEDLTALIKKYRPAIIVVERLFFAKNAKTAMSVGQARGVILLAVGDAGAQLLEFTPPQVKMALTSYGKASKGQIQQMVKSILKLKSIPKPDDAADALAIALCGAQIKRI